jgi:hypothetical protein
VLRDSPVRAFTFGRRKTVCGMFEPFSALPDMPALCRKAVEYAIPEIASTLGGILGILPVLPLDFGNSPLDGFTKSVV